ncbi:S-layer homology domain-containing protein [Cohnella sp. AR92]|uniref:S-layer homology domain-containing protein n=1 Tax=Cohnella sp. AR92 TaxID=648716 RepID=UPI001315508D|nr:S-layer homology domain-containing protein [Cohnella sp. AR92]
MASIKRMAACLAILSIFISSTSYAETVPAVNEDGWDTFYRLQPADMSGNPASRLFQWAISANIIEGYPDGTVKPDQPVTEAEFLKMLYRGFGIAIPTQIYPPGYQATEDWSDAPYRMAKLFNHPALGLSNSKLRTTPITRQHAAEIISAAQGVHYTGDKAVAYIVGNRMAIGSPLTTDDFHPNETFTRTEAVQWIRHLTIRGMMEIKSRPAEPSDTSLLPKLPLAAAEEVSFFSAVPLTASDFDLVGPSSSPKVEFGAPKSAIDQRFLATDELDVFDMNDYGLFAAHFNDDGRLDSWRVEQVIEDPTEPTTAGPLLGTNKGIVPGDSTLFDIFQQYGTYGYIGNGIVNYLYERTNDGSYRPLPSISYFSQLENPEEVYLLSFIVDKKTLKVTFILAAGAPYAYSGGL